MPALDERAGFFRRAVLRNAPWCYAVMRIPDEVRCRIQTYDERRGRNTDAMIARHLAGQIALAAPAAVDGYACLLQLDIDVRGLEAVRDLIAETHRRKLWAFEQFYSGSALADPDERRYVRLVFEEIVDTDHLQALGAELIAASKGLEWKVEPRGIHAVSRLPRARHQHTERFGDLFLTEQTIGIDRDPPGALDELHRAYRENSSAALSELPLPPQPAPRPAATQRNEDQPRDYGARLAKQRRLSFWPFHLPDHVKLQVYATNGHR